MRADKMTTKFQQALAEAQSIALGADNQFIEPAHLLAAMLEQDGSVATQEPFRCNQKGKVSSRREFPQHDGSDVG